MILKDIRKYLSKVKQTIKLKKKAKAKVEDFIYFLRIQKCS